MFQVHRIVGDDGLYPFHIQRVQALFPDDHQHRQTYCQWLLSKVNSDPEFVSNILFTDEARFTRDGVVNVHNTHVYAHENPHEIIAGHHQQQWGINLWAGIVGGHLIGPYMLEGNLNASKYLAFLQEVLPGLLEDVPLQTRREMWYQHDGAPPHFGTQVRDHLNSVYPGKWIGRGVPDGLHVPPTWHLRISFYGDI